MGGLNERRTFGRVHPSDILPSAERIQTYTVSEDGGSVFVGIATAHRAMFFLRMARRTTGSEKLCGIISTWMDFAATHTEPAGRQ